MERGKRRIKRIGALALVLILCLSPLCLPEAQAAESGGLTVERVFLREILRSYTADPAGFDSDNGPQALAELFAATVGLNYYGEGNPASYFAKDVTGKFGEEPYVPGNLVGSYDVDIHPVNGRADPTPGEKWTVHVFLTGYAPGVSGADPVYHYLWQDNGSWWAVRDHVPYYRIRTGGSDSSRLVWIRTVDVSRVTEGGWTPLEGAAMTATGVDCTYAAVEGSAAVFALLDESGRVQTAGEYVSGSGRNGPVLHSCTVSRGDGSVVAPEEALIPGETYAVRVVYEEPLKLAQRGGQLTVSAVRAHGEDSSAVSNVVWYGAEEYLQQDYLYNPRTVEFSLTVAGGSGQLRFTLSGVVGHDSQLAPAVFHRPAAEGDAARTAEPEAPAETPAPTAEPAATAEPTAEPTSTPAAETPAPVTPAPTEEPVSFDPNALVTWSDMALRLWVQQGRPDVVNDPAQTDRYRALCWAAGAGLCELWAGGDLTADTAMTREQTAVALYNYARHLGRDTSAWEDLSLRPDGASVSPWAADGVRWAIGSGVLTPAVDGSVAPGATVSHSQLDWMLGLF